MPDRKRLCPTCYIGMEVAVPSDQDRIDTAAPCADRQLSGKSRTRLNDRNERPSGPAEAGELSGLADLNSDNELSGHSCSMGLEPLSTRSGRSSRSAQTTAVKDAAYFTAEFPPSANSAEPVTKLDAGPAKNNAACAISSGWAIRFIAWRPAAQSFCD